MTLRLNEDFVYTFVFFSGQADFFKTGINNRLFLRKIVC